MEQETKPGAKCEGCSVSFPSRNAVFRHLRDTNGACLSSQDYKDFCDYVQSKDLAKVLILYGYFVSPQIKNGDDACQYTWQAVQTVSGSSSSSVENNNTKLNRSYGCTSRGTDTCAQDNGTGALTEVLMCKLPRQQCMISETKWLDQVNSELNKILPKNNNICVMGRFEMPHKKFNAEMDVTHRRVEYILPVDFLLGKEKQLTQEFMDSFTSFKPGFAGMERPSEETVMYLYSLKKTMQLLTTQIEKLDLDNEAAVMEKACHHKKRQRRRRKQRPDKKHKQEQKDKDETNRDSFKGKNVLRRRRFHNFTPRLMAHEFLASRRLDRFHHCGTIRFANGRPFLVLSLKGDLFLNGQACRVVGLFLALCRGVIDKHVVDCIFDEDYPHLVPAPPVPSVGLYALEASYATWEGKAQAILSPRDSDRYAKGFNNPDTLKRVEEFKGILRESIAQEWFEKGICNKTNRLVAEQEWTRDVLEPWAERAKQQLQQYRQWKSVQEQDSKQQESTETKGANHDHDDATVVLSSTPMMVDPTVPPAYAKVLTLLREADTSGLWPCTTPKRQLVMISTHDSATSDSKQPSSLSQAHMVAKSNVQQGNSAYAFVEGQGGASGSFSVGYMPNSREQPKANALFSELTKAAFELEVSLLPGRQASSTIAINRNAQFRPHVDSGAGAGQSISLIVGLGTYEGGELVVEGETRDIRYCPVEFNGWKQRHWTMPFKGERYSLVWFTPKGCEGKRGIDLFQNDE